MQPSESGKPAAVAAEPAQRPTRARFVVLGLLCAMSFVLYLDRVCMGQAVKPIREELDLSKTLMGWVQMAFTLAYGLFEVPTGHWGDRFGARRVLTRIVLWWSAFTALTGACTGFWSLLLVRFVFGAGEAGAYPNTARVLARWFPLGERGRYQGFFLTASLVGGSLAPGVAAVFIDRVGWRWMFVIFGGMGVVWAVVFAWWFRDDPAEHAAVNAAERALIGPGSAGRLEAHAGVPWRAALTNRNIWLLAAVIAFSAFTSYLYFSWYPTYLEEGRGISNQSAGWLASLVLAGGAAGTLWGGFVADWITRAARDRSRARRRYCSSVYSLAALLLWAGMLADSPLATSLFAGISYFAMMSQQPSWWACVGEITGRHLGALFGLMNGIGAAGAIASQLYFGAFADWREQAGHVGREQWDPAFAVNIVALLAAAACWQFVDASRKVVPPEDVASVSSAG